MNIGVPRERRPFEHRVGLTPYGVDLFVSRGHTVYVESQAGVGAGFPDEDYVSSGAQLVYSGEEAYGRADLVLKVARPLQNELEWLVEGQTLMGFFYLPSTQRARIEHMLKSRVTVIAYERIQKADGTLPVLHAESQIAGRLTAQVAARLMENGFGGRGVLLGGVTGVAPAEVVIIGAGTVGEHVARAMIGLGATVYLMDRNLSRLQQVADNLGHVVTLHARRRNIARLATFADVLVGAVNVPGERAPIVVSREMVKTMKRGALIMDLSINAGGCFETSRPTTLDRPVYVEEGIRHFCVPNMSSAVARTSTHALMNAAWSYLRAIADHGLNAALDLDPALAAGVNLRDGKLVNLTRPDLTMPDTDEEAGR